MSEVFFTFGTLFFISTIITQVIVVYNHVRFTTTWLDD